MPVKKKRAKRKAAPNPRAVKKAAPNPRAAKKAAPKKRATKKAAPKKRAAKKRPAPKKRAAKKRPARKKAAPKKRPAKKKAAPKKKRAAKKKSARSAAPKKKRAAKKSPKKKVAQSVVSPRSPRIRRKTPKPKQRNSQSTQNIKRIDSEKTHGWQVHVCRGGVLRTKLFSDRVHGNKRAALAEAKRFRTQLRAEMAQNIAPSWRNNRSPKTNTGHLGVSYTEARRGDGEVKGYITVTARVAKGRAVNRKFSIDKGGYDHALEQAVAWRDEQLNKREESERISANGSLRN